MSTVNLPLPCRRAIQQWECRGARTLDRLEDLVAQCASEAGQENQTLELQRLTRKSVPNWKIQQS
ncbi:hypothetical protein [Noviherbaspirillum pedocola]|uniref:Uncharacterized protein n=1 Tax=Noviherbaspirillum pedocola TaxID=2801341 RepID=A0A934T1P6_9BURK|nr:hypothetical protein [Noviherbaspirillum pedocola]MBK4735983.1 hypothetical protein [Noviherbaspirillum pedocola]